MRAILLRVLATLALSIATCTWTPAQDDLFGDGNQLPPQILERLEKNRRQAIQSADEAEPGKKTAEKADAEKDEGDKKLDAFFDELEKLVSGNDERSKIIKAMLAEYEQEYKDLELQLADPPTDAGIVERQKIITQYHQNLSTRSLSNDPSRMHEILSAMSDRIRVFRRENPELARKGEFRDRERALRNKAMQANRFAGHRSNTPPSMKETMSSLSASSEVIDHWAPRQLRAHPGEQKGPLQAAHFTMRRLLRLKWNGDNLALDRGHWDTAFAGQFPQDIQTDVDHLLEKRGIEPYANDNERQQRLRLAQRGFGFATDSPLANLGRIFQEFNTTSGRSFTGSGNAGRWSAQSTDMSARLDADLAKLTLSYEELSYPGRLFRLHTVGDTLQLTLLGDFIHRFQQQVGPGGNSTLQITEILDDEVLNYKVTSFAELYRQQPRYVEERFFPLLEHLGVVPPHSRFDQPITDRVVDLLSGDRAAIQTEFDAIAQDLDVDQFTKREAAYRKLRADLDKYFPFLYAKSKEASISRETQARITKLLEIGNKNGTAELDSTISALGLTNDAEYLAELAETLDDNRRPIVTAQLQSLASP